MTEINWLKLWMVNAENYSCHNFNDEMTIFGVKHSHLDQNKMRQMKNGMPERQTFLFVSVWLTESARGILNVELGLRRYGMNGQV